MPALDKSRFFVVPRTLASSPRNNRLTPIQQPTLETFVMSYLLVEDFLKNLGESESEGISDSVLPVVCLKTNSTMKVKLLALWTDANLLECRKSRVVGELCTPASRDLYDTKYFARRWRFLFDNSARKNPRALNEFCSKRVAVANEMKMWQ